MANPNGNPQNLQPFTGADDPRRHNGRPKGIKNWSTIVQDLLADETLLEKLYKRKPDWFDTLPTKNAANAVVAAMTMMALNGDKGAAEWLRKTGFGDKLDVTSMGERIETSPIIISEIKARVDNAPEGKQEQLESQ